MMSEAAKGLTKKRRERTIATTRRWGETGRSSLIQNEKRNRQQRIANETCAEGERSGTRERRGGKKERKGSES